MSAAARRTIVTAGLGLVAGALSPGWLRQILAAEPVEIRMISDPEGSIVHFDPIGILVAPGQRIRWRCIANVHTATAYHPRNGKHSLRIPETAQPWNSGYLLPGQTFETTVTIEGVYDYFCVPHEMAGMVGRIIAGKPSGPGARAFDYFLNQSGTGDWLPIPKPAQEAFPSVARIMAERVVHPPGVPS